MRYQLNPLQARHKDFLLSIRRRFANEGDTIYSGRNQLKSFQVGDKAILVKSFRRPGAIRGLIYSSLRKTKAARSYANALELLKRSIPTPEPIGYVEYLDHGRLTDSYYLSDFSAGVATLREPLLDHAYPGREKILSAFGEFVEELHRNGVLHRDLSPGNILIFTQKETTKFGAIQFSLVDVNRMSFGQLGLPERMKNFSSLWADDADLELMMAAYCRKSGDNPQQAIALAKQYSHHHKRRAARKERLKAALCLS